MAKSFQEAQPFPHIVIDGMVCPDKLAKLDATFPKSTWDGWLPDRAGKQYYSDLSGMPTGPREFVNELHSGTIVRALEEVTGETGLVPDPHLFGAGLHLSPPGTTLPAHSDFVNGRIPGLERRLTLIVYLGKGWSPEHQGELDLWKGRRLAKRIEPRPGRIFIMTTRSDAVHGISNPVRTEDRKSIAVFYYGARGRDAESPLSDATHWRLTLGKGQDGFHPFTFIASVLFNASFQALRLHRWIYDRATWFARSR